MPFSASVKYKHWNPSLQKNNQYLGYQTASIFCDGKTESSVLVALRKKHPGDQIELVEVNWR